ncbi:GNAT family N-acetyltransferase [Actinocrispum sp. NPDC049592]|uniref:GNAT family N-acetyltransferase n=1 Tax=Actinocrispum sp. NPDC049592 TaxID=3154835 RepID=UPI00341A4667
MPVTYQLHKLSSEDLANSMDELVELYRPAFSEPPWQETPEELARYADRLSLQLDTYPGITGVGAKLDGRLVGVVYGWPAMAEFPDTPFYDSLKAAIPAEARQQLLAPALEIVQLMVGDAHRGNGIGRLLLEVYTDGWPKAWLCTHPKAPARRLYDRAGWQAIGEFLSDRDVPRVVYTKAPS